MESNIEHYDPDPIIRSEEGAGSLFGDVVASRLSRRDVMKAGLGVLAFSSIRCAKPETAPEPTTKTVLSFEPIKGQSGDQVVVPEGFQHDVVLKWGDPTLPGAPDFDASAVTGESQAAQFGYNCDFVGFLPLPVGSESSNHGLLGVNHEYINPELMFSKWSRETVAQNQVDVMMAAVGFSVTEIERKAGSWTYAKEGAFNQRVTGRSEFDITGPAKGHPLMDAQNSQGGTKAYGTFANCSAGKTPWGTVLSGEENFQSMFGNGKAVQDEVLRGSYDRYGIMNGRSHYGWEDHEDRFDCGKDPNQPNHFGWVIEVDPYDPGFTPCKRTALGRIRHEAATTFVSKGDKVVMYSGDDAIFEYIYKFVAAKPFNHTDRKANRDILDEGVLYAAKFNADGTGTWLRLVHGEGPLTAENGFNNQGDVVINARRAGDLLGATKMDRPEDIEVKPVDKKVYVACTNNSARGKEGQPAADEANPRDENKHGHIVEMTETDDDHASETFTWELFLVCGEPDDEETHFAGYPKDEVTAISCPDNLAFDHHGNLWIATDGQNHTLGINDGIFAVPVEGEERGKLRQFMSSVTGSEVCGPEFTPDNTTLFLAIQHPGERSTFDEPSTSWPEESGPPKPSVIAITAKDGSAISD